MKKILNLLIAVFMTQLVFTAYGKYSDFGDEDGDFGDEDSDFSGNDSQHYTEITQKILKQVRKANSRKEKPQIYYVKEDATNVFAYSSARSAAIRLENQNAKNEKKIERRFKPGQKVKIVPLKCGVGFIRRAKQPSILFVVMEFFESEKDRSARIEEEAATESSALKLGMALVRFDDGVLFKNQKECEKAAQYASIGEEESKQWFQYVLKKQNGIVVNSGESVMIVEIEGECVKVLFRDSEWWTLARFLKMK